ncbi:MAG: hypothetical protein WC945_07080 [Bacteroidales bacterium]
MKKILFFASFISILLLAIACEHETVTYSGDGGVDASFPSNILKLSMVSEDNNQITVEMWRGNTQGAVSVPITVSGSTDVFTPEKNQFDFSDGEAIAYLKFSYPSIDNFGGEAYKINIEISNAEDVSPGGRSSIEVTAQRKLTFELQGEGSFTSEIFGSSWPQEVFKAVEANYYKLPGLYYENFDIEFSVNNGVISFAEQETGYVHSTYGMASWGTKYSSESSIDGNNYYFVVDFIVDAGSFGKNTELLQMP